MALTNVVSEGVNTVWWLAEVVTTIAVPVWQRHYRWGSILAKADTGDAAVLMAPRPISRSRALSG